MYIYIYTYKYLCIYILEQTPQNNAECLTENIWNIRIPKNQRFPQVRDSWKSDCCWKCDEKAIVTADFWKIWSIVESTCAKRGSTATRKTQESARCRICYAKLLLELVFKKKYWFLRCFSIRNHQESDRCQICCSQWIATTVTIWADFWDFSMQRGPRISWRKQ